MSLRKNWRFEYGAEELAAAASKKTAHHNARLSWWTDKQAEVKKKIQDEGIEIHESVAQTAGSYSNTGRNPGVSVRYDLAQNLDECSNKMTEHRAKMVDYDGWVQALKANPKKRFELDQEDYLFFFGT